MEHVREKLKMFVCNVKEEQSSSFIYCQFAGMFYTELLQFARQGWPSYTVIWQLHGMSCKVYQNMKFIPTTVFCYGLISKDQNISLNIIGKIVRISKCKYRTPVPINPFSHTWSLWSLSYVRLVIIYLEDEGKKAEMS